MKRAAIRLLLLFRNAAHLLHDLESLKICFVLLITRPQRSGSKEAFGTSEVLRTSSKGNLEHTAAVPSSGCRTESHQLQPPLSIYRSLVLTASRAITNP